MCDISLPHTLYTGYDVLMPNFILRYVGERPGENKADRFVYLI